MSNVQMTPQRYAKILEEYDLVLGHAYEMSDRLTWRLVVQHYLSYAETIFTETPLACNQSPKAFAYLTVCAKSVEVKPRGGPRRSAIGERVTVCNIPWRSS